LLIYRAMWLEYKVLGGGGIRRLARKVGKSKATKDRSVKVRSVNVSH
jgi:hypothetical protein